MSQSEAEVVIDGPRNQVFDVVTIADLWPQWIVMTRAVSGVIERPIQKGDRIYKFRRRHPAPRARWGR